MAKRPRRVTVPSFAQFKQSGHKISMLTAYDFPTAKLVDQAGVNAILVGDSLSMVVQGHETTLPVTLDQMIYHAEMVGRATERALVVVDMPFPTYHLGREKTIENAARILKETRCHAVKLEGGTEQASTIAALTSAGIPVMGHVGLRPQRVHQTGYRVQRDKQSLLNEARAVEDAGAFSLVLECVTSSLAGAVSAAVKIPTIGIGAGNQCDGQVLVIHDLLGMTTGYVPKFVKKFANLEEIVTNAVQQYCDEVRDGRFPDDDRSFEK